MMNSTSSSTRGLVETPLGMLHYKYTGSLPSSPSSSLIDDTASNNNNNNNNNKTMTTLLPIL
jgi:hypothetical protein